VVSCLNSKLIFGQGQFWRITGNNNTNSTANFLGTTTNDGLSIRTNDFQRMFINNGLGGNNDGRIAFGNNLPVGFVPLDRLHLHHSNAGGTAIGMRFTSAVSGTGALDGYATGYASTGTPHVYFTSFELNTPFC
jgi:hypothetical protein